VPNFPCKHIFAYYGSAPELSNHNALRKIGGGQATERGAVSGAVSRDPGQGGV
jgi:hypothetical protein